MGRKKKKPIVNRNYFSSDPLSLSIMVSFQILNPVQNEKNQIQILNPKLILILSSIISLSLSCRLQLIFSAFKTLTNQQVTIELKNDLAITGTLKSVDQFLNFRVDEIKVEDPERWPHMVSYSSMQIERWDAG